MTEIERPPMNLDKNGKRILKGCTPGICHVALELMMDEGFQKAPDDIAEKALRQAAKSQEIADAGIYKMCSRGGARGLCDG